MPVTQEAPADVQFSPSLSALVDECDVAPPTHNDTGGRRRGATRIVPLADSTPRRRTVALGVFDGVHRGHVGVIDGADTVVTFDPPPALAFGRADPRHLLTTIEQRADLVGRVGVTELVVVKFTPDMAATPPGEFVQRYLIERLGAERVCVGQGFRFGRAAAGTSADLAAMLETSVVPTIFAGGERVSSSRIRDCVRAGDVRGAATLLGRNVALSGVIASAAGDRFIADARHVLPASRRYAALLHVAGITLDVAASPDGDGWRMDVQGPWQPGEPARLELIG